MSVSQANLSATVEARPGRIRRHLVVDRLYHWIMAACVLTLLATAFLPIIGVKFDWLGLHWMTGVVLAVLVVWHIVRASIWQSLRSMVIDTGATSVVLTYETAKAAGLPLELLEYDVDVETAGGHTRAARLTLDRLAIGNLVERSVPALVVPHGQMKTNLLGMSFLDRLESWEVHADRLMLHGYP